MSAYINNALAIATIAIIATACGEVECPDGYTLDGDMCLLDDADDTDQPPPDIGDDDDDDGPPETTPPETGCTADQAMLEIQNHTGETLVIAEMSRTGDDWVNLLYSDNIRDGKSVTFCIDSGEWDYLWLVGDELGCDLYDAGYFKPGEAWYFKALPFGTSCE